MNSGILSANVGDKWSTEMIIHFLEEYENYPCLWDSRHRLHKSKSDRISAEVDIMKKMKIQYLDLNVFRSKVRNIRNTYRQEATKIMKISKPEAGADGMYVPKLRWFNLADSFLRKTLELNEAPSAQRCQEEVTSEPDVPVDDSAALEFEDVKPGVDDLGHFEASSWNQSPPARNHSPHKRACPWESTGVPPSTARLADDEKSDSAVEPPPPPATAEVERRASAEFDAFGKYVSAQLQQLPLDVAVELEMEIVNLVCRKRLCLLREGTEFLGSGCRSNQQY